MTSLSVLTTVTTSSWKRTWFDLSVSLEERFSRSQRRPTRTKYDKKTHPSTTTRYQTLPRYELDSSNRTLAARVSLSSPAITTCGGVERAREIYPVSLSFLHPPPKRDATRRDATRRDVRHHTVVTAITETETFERRPKRVASTKRNRPTNKPRIKSESRARAFRTSNPAGNPGLVRLTNSIADADDPLAVPDVPDRAIVGDSSTGVVGWRRCRTRRLIPLKNTRVLYIDSLARRRSESARARVSTERNVERVRKGKPASPGVVARRRHSASSSTFGVTLHPSSCSHCLYIRKLGTQTKDVRGNDIFFTRTRATLVRVRVGRRAVVIERRCARCRDARRRPRRRCRRRRRGV